MLVAVAALVEGASFAFFTTFRSRFRFYDLGDYLLRPNELERCRKSFDKDLGWIYRFDSPFGERPRARDYGRPLIATFGDSFTYGVDVRFRETFQTYLSDLLHADVYNLGVGGYGTDQAYLRFRRDYPKLRTPIVVLGLISENINRTVNVYRRFYYPPTGGPMTKPRFVREDGGRRLLPNPIQDARDVERLMDPAFLRTIGTHDYWYNHADYPVLAFPYAKILLNPRIWHEALAPSDRRPDDVDARPWDDLWLDPPIRELYLSILDSFVDESKALGGLPVILIFPRVDEVLTEFRGGDAPRVRHVLDHCAARKYSCFDAVRVLADSAGNERDVRGFFTSHLTAGANRLVAERFREYLLREGLLAEAESRAAAQPTTRRPETPSAGAAAPAPADASSRRRGKAKAATA
ncbi:MAG: hypothetical protein QOD06_1132 [Candidatus Binatota bacterium]|nr:hypothetical protein [Candidatus Binatota bacterium]